MPTHGEVDRDRRRYIARLALAVAGAGLGTCAFTAAVDRESRDLAGIDRATQWLNSPPLTAQGLAGKVVLIDFWTYTCINWLRTLPHVRAWAQKYHRNLVVIGVHTPEFPFEHDIDHVRRAVRQRGIDYPVAIDNNYAIWSAFSNQYWPALYFVDGRGRIREHEFGEGNFERSERTIEKLLRDAGVSDVPGGFVSPAADGVELPADWTNLRSPEQYLGTARTQGFSSPGGVKRDRPHVYATPERLALNTWALGGEWTAQPGLVTANTSHGRLRYRFHARDLHIVMGAARPGASVRFRASLDGRPPAAAHGVDADADGIGTLAEPRLYQLIRQPGPIVDRTFEIEFVDAGVQAFSFTFG